MRWHHNHNTFTSSGRWRIEFIACVPQGAGLKSHLHVRLSLHLFRLNGICAASVCKWTHAQIQTLFCPGDTHTHTHTWMVLMGFIQTQTDTLLPLNYPRHEPRTPHVQVQTPLHTPITHTWCTSAIFCCTHTRLHHCTLCNNKTHAHYMLSLPFSNLNFTADSTVARPTRGTGTVKFGLGDWCIKRMFHLCPQTRRRTSKSPCFHKGNKTDGFCPTSLTASLHLKINV